MGGPNPVERVDRVLAHHGVKGMKWGVHRSEASGGPAASSDAQAATATKLKIKTGGTKVLSNQELQGLITRMNLESQYHNLSTSHKSELDKGLKATKKALQVGKTVEDLRKFMATPTGQAVKTGLKASLLAVKVGVAFKTGGASAAASKGTEIAIRRMANHYTNVGN